MSIHLFKEMLEKVIIKKDASLIPFYYHTYFLFYVNDQVITYNEYLKLHQGYFATPIQYEIAYDEDTLMEQGDKVAGRIWITTRNPHESSDKTEIIFIVQYKENKIYRLWELTHPV